MGIFDNPNESWRQYGEKDPYYGVLSAEEFRAKNLTQDSLNAFFGSGEAHIEQMLRTTAERRKARQFLPLGLSICAAAALFLNP